MFSYMNRGSAFYRSIVTLSGPIILQNLISTLLGLCDTFMVGLLGESAMAAVTLANIPIFVVTLLIFGLQSGSSVLFSQYWGRRDTDSINRVMGVGFWLAGTLTLIFALAMWLFPLPIMNLLTSEPELAAQAAKYARFAGFSYFFNGLNSIYIGAHRSMGNPQLGLRILSLSVVLNTLLNYMFIFGNLGAPRMEVAGAAFATLLSRMVESVVTAIYAVKNQRFRLKPALVLRPGADTFKRFVRYSGPVVANETLWGLGYSVYPTIMGHMAGATSILAAYTLEGNLDKLLTVVIMGLSASTTVIIGNDIGAGKKEEDVHQNGACLMMLSLLCGIVIGAIMLVATHLFFEPYLYPVFQLTDDAAEITTMMLTVVACVLPARALDICGITGVLRGGGDVRASVLIDMLPMWLISIPLAAVAGLVLGCSITQVYICITVEEVLKVFILLWRFRGRKWIHDVTKGELS